MTEQGETNQPASETIALQGFTVASDSPESKEKGWGPLVHRVYEDGKILIKSHHPNPVIEIHILREREGARVATKVFERQEGATPEYRPGLWIKHLEEVYRRTTELMRERENQGKARAEEHPDWTRFLPVDNSDIFGQPGN